MERAATTTAPTKRKHINHRIIIINSLATTTTNTAAKTLQHAKFNPAPCTRLLLLRCCCHTKHMCNCCCSSYSIRQNGGHFLAGGNGGYSSMYYVDCGMTWRMEICGTVSLCSTVLSSFFINVALCDFSRRTPWRSRAAPRPFALAVAARFVCAFSRFQPSKSHHHPPPPLQSGACRVFCVVFFESSVCVVCVCLFDFQARAKVENHHHCVACDCE